MMSPDFKRLVLLQKLRHFRLFRRELFMLLRELDFFCRARISARGHLRRRATRAFSGFAALLSPPRLPGDSLFLLFRLLALLGGLFEQAGRLVVVGLENVRELFGVFSVMCS